MTMSASSMHVGDNEAESGLEFAAARGGGSGGVSAVTTDE
jgi:hypothetical protein